METLRNTLLQIGLAPEVAEQFAEVELPFSPFKHQKRALHMALSYNRFGCLLPARTGKTLVLQLSAIYFAKYGMKTMTIMPPGLFLQYFNDFNKIKNHGLNIHTFVHSPAKRKELLKSWEDGKEPVPEVLLISREIFKSEFISLYRLGFANLQFDESHMGLQSTSSQTYKKIKEFIQQRPHHRLVLSTGTPIPSALENAFGTVSLLNPFAYKSERHFKATHVVYKEIYISRGGRRDTIYVPDKYINHDVLNQALYKTSITVSKLEVLNLSAPNIQIIDTQLSRRHRALYERVLRERILETPAGLVDARQVQKLRMVALQLLTCPEVYEESFKSKDNAVFETVRALLDSINTDQNKVLLFANFTNSVETLKGLLAPLQPAVVYGPNGPAKNQQEVEKFRNDPDCRVMIANPVAGGVGFTLGDVCTTVIFVEPVSSPGQFDQALSRTLLYGQKEPVVAYILRIVDTISPRAIDLMQGRVEDLDKVMHDRRSIFNTLKVPAPR